MYRGVRALITSKERVRARLLQVAFGLTLKEWDVIFTWQNGRCFICGKVSKRRLHTDHDHKTGLCRGLLCPQCNRALGKAQDPRWQWTAICFYRAYIYLLNPPATEALGRKVYGYPGKIGTKKYRKWAKKRKSI